MDFEFLTDFLKTYRPTGFEKAGSDLFQESFSRCPDVRLDFVDRMWNVCVSKGSESPDALKILISAHSDQNCLMVSGITENGFLKYVPQGGISPRTLIDTEMTVFASSGKLIPCFCSYKAIHLEKPDDRKKCPEHKDLYLDLGCTSKAQVENLGINVGDLVVFDNSRLDMKFGPERKFIVGSGLDDGVACGIVYDILRYTDTDMLVRKNVRLYGALITSEETGARGVGPVVKRVNPDISIDLDVCHDCTREIGKDPGSDISMGEGVVLSYGPDKYRPLVDELYKIGYGRHLKMQKKAGKAGGTNTDNIQKMSGNCATALLSIPCRYMHSSTHEMVSRDDLEACDELIAGFLEDIDVNEWRDE